MTNITWHQHKIDSALRAQQKQQQAVVLWFTGLSGSGKSTIANLVDEKLFHLNKHSYLLDGDNIRHGLNGDLGFSDQDRAENIRRITEVAALMVDAGLIVSTAFISPFIADRKIARECLGKRFIEVYVDTPIGECIKRDPKGLYQKVLRGEIKNFTGIDSVYETPKNPELYLNTMIDSADKCAHQVIEYLKNKNFI